MINQNLQQKIYIDVDEEITTVIDHIYRVKGNDIALIVPQRALLLQSVVNLKLLAQEAKKYGKNIILMTRDEDGIAFAQRAGLIVQPFVAEGDEEEIEMSVPLIQQEKKHVPKYAEKIMQEEPQQRTNTDMGSQSFFGNDGAHGKNVAGVYAGQSSKSHVVRQEENTMHAHEQSPQADTEQQVQKNHNINSVAGVYPSTHQNQMTGNSAAISQKQQVPQQSQNNEQEYLDEYEQSLRNAQLSNGAVSENTQLQSQQRKSPQQAYTQVKKTENDIVKKSAKTKKHNDMAMSAGTGFAVKSFIFGGIVLVLCILFITILPKTKISLEPKHINMDETIEMTAKTDQSVYDAERRLVPARLIERDITFTKTFNATGSGDVKAQKAQGTITIFNEYNDKSQPLVATTRFLAEDGTLFRLVNQVTVPGMKGDEAGSVEALVIADVEGNGGNIGPTRFSVPGFEGSPKKDKFYATSEKDMAGGGAGGDAVAIVTEDDIEAAKTEMTEETLNYIMEQITGLLRPDNEVLIDENVTYEVIRSEANMSAGTMAEQFMYEVVSHVKVLVFSEDDVLAVMESDLTEKYHQYDANQVQVQVEYEDVISNFEEESIKMKAHGTADIVTTVDAESFKKDIVSKKHDELLKIMEDTYGDEIEKITIESVFPSFPSFIADRISRFEFMTDVIVE